MDRNFQASFIVEQVDAKGKPFESVSRISCSSEDKDSELELDYNCSIYSLKQGDTFAMTLTDQVGGKNTDQNTSWHPSMLDNSTFRYYEYVMFGRITQYKEETAEQRASLYVSFGGLLMRLTSTQGKLHMFARGQDLFILIRKLSS